MHRNAVCSGVGGGWYEIRVEVVVGKDFDVRPAGAVAKDEINQRIMVRCESLGLGTVLGQ